MNYNKTITAPAVELLKTKPTFSVPLVVPITTNEKIMEAWKNFQDLKIKLLEDNDFVEIRGERYAKKSAFRKLALAFGVSTELVKEEVKENKGSIIYHITMKAIAPSGRFMTAVASCQSDERKFSKASDVRAIAQTRSTNRCIADIIGWSAPSAEEMITAEEREGEQPENNNKWLNNVFGDDNLKPKRDLVETDDERRTEKQRDLLISLLYRKVANEDERAERLEMVENFSKREASEAISELLHNNN